MVVGELQGVVDALASTIGRPVGVDDRRFRSLAYSYHADSVDPVRLASILHREAPDSVTGWLESLGILDAEGFMRVPSNPSFGMAARVCIPIRFDAALLGFLWLIDEPDPLSADELDEALRFTEELSNELFRLGRLEHDENERELGLLQVVCGGMPGADRAAAALELVRDGILATGPVYAVAVLAAANEDVGGTPDAVRVRLQAATEHERRAVAPRHWLIRATGDSVAVVLAANGATEVDRRARSLVAQARASLQNHSGWEPVVALGDTCTTPVGLPVAYDQAQLAIRVQRSVGDFGPLVAWSALGVYKTLAPLAEDRNLAALVPAPLQRLLDCSEADVLVPTLERWLDLGGDARATAADLYLHRSSLYGRLRRIEQITGLDLRSGEVRLELHLGLRLRRLASRR